MQRHRMRAVALALREALYPTTCMMCDARVQEEGALCPACWAETPFLSGTCCDLCGTALPGEDDGPVRCDDCLTRVRPWDSGRAVLAYAGGGRRLVLSFKHGDRTELARGAGRWMHRRARDLLTPETLVVPVPIHRWRLLRRRYNQSALLAREVARQSSAVFAPMALLRHRETPRQDHHSVTDRFANVAQAISLGARTDVAGRRIVLIDDVLTSGATLAACTDVLRQGGAARIDVLVLARVAKDA